jgi:hypothetical protein
MSSKLEAILMENDNDCARRMMPPPPPPPPLPSKLSKLIHQVSQEEEVDPYDLISGGELELLAETALAHEHQEDEFYDLDEGLQGSVANNLGRNLS